MVGSRAVSGALLTSTGALRIGGNNIWGEYFKGKIDEVRIKSDSGEETTVKEGADGWQLAAPASGKAAESEVARGIAARR